MRDVLAEIDWKFRFHPAVTKARIDAHERIRECCRYAALNVNELCPEGREKSLAFTKLEEAMFWANAAIAREKEN